MGIGTNDFDVPLADWGTTVKWYVSTKLILENGSESLTYGTGTDIVGVLNFKTSIQSQHSGQILETNGYLMVKNNIAIKKDDLIEWNSNKFLVNNTQNRGPPNSVPVYIHCDLVPYHDYDIHN
jgi:hypothetical protein